MVSGYMSREPYYTFTYLFIMDNRFCQPDDISRKEDSGTETDTIPPRYPIPTFLVSKPLLVR